MEKFDNCGIYLKNPRFVSIYNSVFSTEKDNAFSGVGNEIFGKASYKAPAIILNNKENADIKYPSTPSTYINLKDVTIQAQDVSEWAEAYSDATQYFDRNQNQVLKYIDEVNATTNSGTSITAWGNNKFSYLVGLFDVPNVYAEGLLLKDGYTGIYAPVHTDELGLDQEGGSHIHLHKSNVSNNLIGILMDGSSDFIKTIGYVNHGELTATCTNFDNNLMGIFGTNITLNIEQIGLSQPNQFKYATVNGVEGVYMDIVYLNSTPLYPNGIQATNNLWVSGGPNSGTDYHIQTCDDVWGSNCTVHDLNVNPMAIDEACEEAIYDDGRIASAIENATPLQKATVQLETGEKDLLPKYLEGIAAYYQKDVDMAIEKLSEIANIDDEVRNASENPYVQMYIDIARTIAPSIAKTAGKSLSTKVKMKQTDAIKIIPNPANEYFMLNLPFGKFNVTITDAVGKVVKSLQVTDSEQISIDDFQSGMYQVKIQNSVDNSVIKVEKLMVIKK